MEEIVKLNDRISQADKDKNNFSWYKAKIARIIAGAFSSNLMGYGNVPEYQRKKVNYDLFNGRINLDDFRHVTQPYGSDQPGELPARITNHDIVSPKIKILLGLESLRPFPWRIGAVNEEATTRKEREETERLRDYVVSEVTKPFRLQAEMKYQEEIKGKTLNDDEKNQIRKEIDDEMKRMTPPEVREYMVRKHQDPAEIQGRHVLKYLWQQEKLGFKFNKGWKHACLSGEEVYYVGIIGGEPRMQVVNSMYFDYERSPDNDFIEQAGWCVAEYYLSSDAVASWFPDLTNTELDSVYKNEPFGTAHFINWDTLNTSTAKLTRVRHVQFKSLREVKFLTYVDNQGTLQLDIVPETYELNTQHGDVAIESQWIPETHEGYLINADIYKAMGPVAGQHKDINNLWNCVLSYKGAAYDNLNSEVTAPMDRIKGYQYFFNVLMYRMENLIASDRGKKLLFNYNMIPKSANIDLKKFLYYLDALNIGFLNPNEEGNRKNGNQSDVSNSVKEVDMSLISDIKKYIDLASYIEDRCRRALGLSPEMEGIIDANNAVTNTKQSIIQSNYILEPYFQLHSQVKLNVLQSIVEVAKVAWSVGKPKKLSYIMDDMTLQMFNVDQELLDNSTLGVFAMEDGNYQKVKQSIEILAQAALQNQQSNLSTVIKVLKTDDTNEAAEILEADEALMREAASDREAMATKIQSDNDERQRTFRREEWQHEKDMVILKEAEKRKTEKEVQLIESMGFDTNKDEDGDGTPDVLEVAKHGLNAEIQRKKVNLDAKKLNHQIENDKVKQSQTNRKLELEAKKIHKINNKPVKN